MARMLSENKESLHDAVGRDLKTALEEKVFEVSAPLGVTESAKSQLRGLRGWMKSTLAAIPKALAASGHTSQVIREPYGVTLIRGLFNGPLVLLLENYLP